MLRLIVIVFAALLALVARPHLANAQVIVGTPTRAIQTLSAGYCFTDINDNDTIDLNEIDVTLDTEAMTDNTVPARDAATTGSRVIVPSAIHQADNWADITTQGNYQIDIAGICIGGVTRTDAVSTDFDDDDPADGVSDRTEATTRTETSLEANYFDDDGFSFVGGTATNEQVINLTGQVSGNVSATAGQSNIHFTLNQAVEIDGLLDLGSTNAISNAVLVLAGQIDEVDLSGASNFTLNSSASIGDTADSTIGYSSATLGRLDLSGVTDANVTLSGSFADIDMSGSSNINFTNASNGSDIDASNVSGPFSFANSGTLSTVDFTGSAQLTADLQNGSSIGTITANNITNPTSSISNAGVIERLEIGNSSATEKVELAVINTGTISANTNAAMVIADTDAAGGDIDVDITNSGAITAATSDALDFSALDGGRLDITNSGSVSTNSSGTNNAINGSGAEGLIFLNNSGTVSNGNNRAVNLQNLDGYFRLVNSGSVNSNQVAIDLTGASASALSAVEIHNGFNLDNSDNVAAATAGDREIKTTGSNALLLDGINGNIIINNSANASIIAENTLAIAASGVSGNISLNNAGNIRAFRQASGLSNERAIAMTATVGDITFQNTDGGLIDARDRTVNLEAVDNKVVFSNAGTIASTQTINDADATATDNYVVRIQRSGTVDDETTITNSGTISSSSDHALLLNGLACDADADGDSYCLTNSGTVSAGRQLALAGDALTDFKFTNSGTVTAFDQTVNLTDLSGAIVVSNAGTISATQGFSELYPDPDSDKYAVRLVKNSGLDGTLSFTNAGAGVISTQEDNALVIVDFDEANDDVVFQNSGTISAVGDNAVDFSDSNVSSITNSGTISAGGNYALLLDGLSGASMVLSNLGTITAGASAVGNTPAAIHGELDASVSAITISNGASGVISSVGNSLTNSDANSGGTIFLDATVAALTLSNSGTILAGVEATASASAIAGNNAIRVTDIGANAVTITNSASASIKSLGDTAIFLEGDSAEITSFNLTNSGTITADDAVVLLQDIAGASAVIANSGTMSATGSASNHLINLTNVSADFSLTNSGIIETAGTRAVYVDMNDTSLTGSDMLVFNNQSNGRIDADSETVTFLEVNEQIDFDNSGVIRATSGASAIRFSGIGNHQVDFTNNVGATISASGVTAVSLADFEAALNFNNGSGATVSAADDTVVLSPTTNNARLDFSNGGTISASAQTADHVLRFVGFGGELAIENLSTGTISSNGTNAIFADHQLATPSLDFDNYGTISSRTGDAVVMSGFTDAVNVVNSGSILVTAGDNAFSSWGGNETVFSNSGRIEASGDRAVYFSDFIVDAGTAAPQFTNTATGIIRAASGAFETAIGAATGQTYTLTNAGSIIADNGALAVNMSGANVRMSNSGTISATASPAILAGASSVIGVSGTVSAGGTVPVAIALEGRGSIVNLSDGAVIVGTILPLDSGTDYTDAEKHRINLSGVSNASYYYEFPTDQFRLFVNDAEKTDGSGFSAATTNLQAMPLIHAHHAQGTRNIWRQLGRFNGDGGLRSFAFADELEDERRSDRQFDLEGDRNGFVQTFQQSVFGWFEAELILVASESSFELDSNTFTIDKSYQAAGFGFSDLLALGPFSLSAMALTGIGQTDMTRLVLSNTVVDGRFNLNSSYDSLFLDAAFEALFNMRVWGKKGRLSRRNPFRINLEIGLGGSLHTESNDGYSEQTYVSMSDSDLQSNSVGGRIKVEYVTRNPYARQNIRAFLELEQNMFETTSGTDFSYSVEGTSQSLDVTSDDPALSSLAIGVVYEIDNDLIASLSYTGMSGDKDSEENSLAVALKWRF